MKPTSEDNKSNSNGHHRNENRNGNDDDFNSNNNVSNTNMNMNSGSINTNKNKINDNHDTFDSNNIDSDGGEAKMDDTNTTTCNTDETVRSLNSVYGNRIGFWQTLSMILNSGLMIYAHVGVSALILSNRQRIDEQINNNNNKNNSGNNNITNTSNDTTGGNSGNGLGIGGACNANDLQLWVDGGNANRTKMSDWCSRGYSNSLTGDFCLVLVSCNSECFQTQFGYSAPCSDCLGSVPQCGLQNACVAACSSAPLSDACNTCNIPCTEQLEVCSGLPPYNRTNNDNSTTTNSTVEPTYDNIDTSLLTNEQRCEIQQEGVPVDVDNSELYVVYTLRFFNAVKDAWNGNAKFLAIFVVLFSGLWPYVKNAIIVYAWYMPLKPRSRNSLLTMLKRLGKYSLADVYAVIIIMVGVLITANIEQVPVVVTAEPRPAIIAFLIATLWEFVHVEWMTEMHHHYYKSTMIENIQNDTTNSTSTTNTRSTKVLSDLHFRKDKYTGGNTMMDRTSAVANSIYDKEDVTISKTPNAWNDNESVMVCKSQGCLQVFVILMLVAVIVTFCLGAINDLTSFTTIAGNDTNGCTKTYNLFTLGAEMVSDEFLHGSTAKAGTWVMFLSYVTLIGLCPLLTLSIQCLVLVFQVNDVRLGRIADVSWSFASVEILLLALILVHPKFDELIAALAGEENAAFFGLESQLGTGFYGLLAYSILAGILQYIFHSAVCEHYRIDPYHKIDYWWTKLFRPFLKDIEAYSSSS